MLWAIHCTDKPDTDKARGENLQIHREYLGNQKNIIVLAGATLSDDGNDMTGSVFIVNVGSREEAKAFSDGDPFTKAESSQTSRSSACARASGTPGRSRARKQSHFAHGRDTGSDLTKRFKASHIPCCSSTSCWMRRERRHAGRKFRPIHQQYLAGEAERFFAAGPLWADDRSAMTGSIFIMDWPNRRDAATWLENEPFTKNDVYGYINIKAYDNKWPKDGRPKVRDTLFAYFNLNGPDAAAPRRQYRQAHLDYLAATQDRIFAAGPLFNDSDATDMEDRAGSLYIVDQPDRAAADAWLRRRAVQSQRRLRR